MRSWSFTHAVACVAALALWGGGCRNNTDKVTLPEVAEPTPPASPPVAAPSAAADPTATSPAGADATAAGDPAAPQVDGQAAFFTGTAEPYRRTVVMPRVGGAVSKVVVKEGDAVKAGAPLVIQDTSMTRLQLQQGEAARRLAQAQIDAVRVEHRRLAELVRAKAVPRGSFEKVDAQLKVALAGMAQADAAVALARKMVKDAVVRAPFSGVVTRVMTEEGMWVATMPPSQLMQLEQIDKLKLRVEVPETAVQQVKVGTPLTVRFTAVGRTVRTRVAQVVRSLNPMTRSFSVIAEMDNRDESLRPGMFAEVHLLGAQGSVEARGK